MRSLILALAAGCASEGSERVQSELARLDLEVAGGVETIERALGDPDFRDLGEGVRIVESAIRYVSRLEGDDEASDSQKLQAILLEARAWDELAKVFERAAAESDLPAVFDEKGMPARFYATSSHARAAEYACSHGLADQLPGDSRPACE